MLLVSNAGLITVSDGVGLYCRLGGSGAQSKAPLGNPPKKDDHCAQAIFNRDTHTLKHTCAQAYIRTHAYTLKTMPHRLAKCRKGLGPERGGFCPFVHSCVPLGYVQSHLIWILVSLCEQYVHRPHSVVSRITEFINIKVLRIMEKSGKENLQPRKSHKETWKCADREIRRNNELADHHTR